MQKKHIQPGEKVALKLTAKERMLVLECVNFLDDNCLLVIAGTPASKPVMMTLDEIDDLSGYVAAEANHCADKKRQKKLDTVFEKAQDLLDRYTDEVPVTGALSMAEARDRIATAMNSLMVGAKPETISFQIRPEDQTQCGSIKLTPLQRETLTEHTELKPAIKRKLMKVAAGTQTIEFTRDELNEIYDTTGEAATYARGREKQRLMAVQAKIVRIFEKDHAALFEPMMPKTGQKPVCSKDIFQFRITLMDIEPPIWRRIQVRDCTLGELHEHIQAAMGWQDCHLHQFTINDVEFGPIAPDAMPFGPEFEDETQVVLSDVLPQQGERFLFGYTYDFGDDWRHEVLLEGKPNAIAGEKYPVCLEGERACPPEDVGGPWGFADYLEALTDPSHDQHAELLEWRGRFDPEVFDAAKVTRTMRTAYH